ncbi:GH3 auxin-responsive promoter [compost metagenome]
MELVNQLVFSAGQTYLKWYSQFMTTSRKDLAEKQDILWKDLRRSLKGTAIYEDMRLEYITSYREYIAHVPVKDFDFYAPYVERICKGEENVLFQGRAIYAGLSSGTSGQNSKRVPYNQDMIDLFIKSQRRTAARLASFESDVKILEVPRLAFGSAPKVYEENGITYGYISGILSTKTPGILKKKTFPSEEVLSIVDWDEKIERLIEEGMRQDIQIVSGIPTYLISIFEAVLKKTGMETLNQIWPNLSIFVYAATPVKQYEERINKLVGHELTYYGLYASTEAPIGLPYKAFTNGVQQYILNPDLLFSFTPVEGGIRAVGIHNLKMNTPYYLNVGTPNGFIHYAMKDQVIFSEVNGDLVFEFVGRKNTGMNLAAEKVSEDDILNTIISAKERLNKDIRHYFVAPTTQNGRPAYHWTLFVDVEKFQEPDLVARVLDEALQQINLDYKDCRDVNVVESPVVKLMCASRLNSYFEKYRAKGQFKMKTTFESPEDFQTFMNMNFVEN